MFDFVRDHKRLLQFLLVLLIFPSFVFFGVQGYSSFTDASNTAVAKVAGGEIKSSELEAAHRQQVERMRQQMPGVDIKLFDTPEMKRQTLDSLVRERVLSAAAAKDHLVVSDDRLAAELMRMPELASVRGPNGAIDRAAYTALLSAQGLTPAGFENNMRLDLALRQVLQGVSGSPVLSREVGNLAVDALLERREIQLQRFQASDYLAKVQPSDADVEAYYKANPAFFRSPEEASIEYVVLDVESLKKQVSVSDDDLRAYYKENQSRYSTPEERRASHILVNAAKDSPAEQRAAAKAKAEGLLAQVRKNPAQFAELASKNSDDKGSAEKGGDLDFFGRGAMVKPFEDAVFAMKADEISNLVESDFGFHIIRLTAVRGGQTKPFEAVRAEIVEEVSKQLAQKKYTEVAEQFSNTVYEQPDSLQPVIDKLKLAKATGLVRRNPAPGATGPLASPKLLEAVFSTDVVKNKRNTEAVETAPNQLVSARIVEHKPERVQPLADVKAQVLERVRAEQAAAAAKKDGLAREAALRQNAADALPVTLTVSRTQIRDLPRPIVDAALRADLSKGPATVGVDLGNAGYAVLKVLKTVAREDKDPDTDRATPYVRESLSRAETAAYYETLKKRFKVELKLPAAAASSAAN